MPHGTRPRAPGASVSGTASGTAATRSRPAASALWYDGSGRPSLPGRRWMCSFTCIMVRRPSWRGTRKRRGDAGDQPVGDGLLVLVGPGLDAVAGDQMHGVVVA